MAIRLWELQGDRLEHRELGPSSALPEPGTRYWLDLSLDDLPALAPWKEHLPGHPLNWEDAGKPGQRPKLEEHGDHLFLIFRGLDSARPRLAEQLRTQQVAFFLGRDFLLSVRSGALPSVEQAQARLVRGGPLLQEGPDALLHAILDDLVDRYAPHAEGWESEIEVLLKEALDRPRQRVMARILAIRKHLVTLRRLALGQREILAQLLRQDPGLIRPGRKPYFQDIHDHLATLVDASETLKDSVAIAVDVYLNSVNNRLNEIMKVLTVMSVVMLPLTLLSGIYGMNFEWMPGLRHPHGFFWILGLMGAIVLGMLAYFRKSNWL